MNAHLVNTRLDNSELVNAQPEAICESASLGAGEPRPVSRRSALRALRASIRADHAFMRSLRERYPTDGTSMRTAGIAGDAVQKVGFQMMIAIRLMHAASALRVPFGAQLLSRLIRHMYGAEIHWDAKIADGVAILHGNGLVISHGATVGPHCVLSQHVTLGESIDPFSRRVGAPTLMAEVHVGAGAVVLGPVEVGAGTKIMANAVLDRSVAPRSIVRTPTASIESRRSADDPSSQPDASTTSPSNASPSNTSPSNTSPGRSDGGALHPGSEP